MLMYEATCYAATPSINIVDVQRETDDSVWIASRRRKRVSWRCAYFKTYAEARQHLISEAEQRVKKARTDLDRHISYLDRAKKLQEAP